MKLELIKEPSSLEFRKLLREYVLSSNSSVETSNDALMTYIDNLVAEHNIMRKTLKVIKTKFD